MTLLQTMCAWNIKKSCWLALCHMLVMLPWTVMFHCRFTSIKKKRWMSQKIRCSSAYANFLFFQIHQSSEPDSLALAGTTAMSMSICLKSKQATFILLTQSLLVYSSLIGCVDIHCHIPFYSYNDFYPWVNISVLFVPSITSVLCQLYLQLPH